MNPALALLFGLALIAWMFARDRRWRRFPSRALWIPAIFLTIASSHQVSYWLYQLGLGSAQTSRLEGSPVNVLFNGTLFLAAIVVLRRRKFSWGGFVIKNKALAAMYLFFLCSALWSPFPVPTVKRTVQDFGCVLAALVILTETEPAASARAVFVRISYILFPLSVVFIKWFPAIGRSISAASGSYSMAGVTGQKNELGQLTAVFCMVLLWDLLETRQRDRSLGADSGRGVRLINLAIGLYLLILSRSATSWIAFVTAIGIFFLGKRLADRMDARRLFATTAVMIAFLVTFGFLYASRFSERLDRGTTLSGRTEIWQTTLEKFRGSYGETSLIGAGFHAFWDSDVGVSVWQQLQTGELIQAHNGYLETYLNGGLIGLVLLTALLLGFGRTAAAKLAGGAPLGRLAVVFWSVLLFVNVTEAEFFQVGPLWFTTLLVVMNGPWDKHDRQNAHPLDDSVEMRTLSAPIRRPIAARHSLHTQRITADDSGLPSRRPAFSRGPRRTKDPRTCQG